ncbi:MAG TPA: peptide ABC transporter substrate-binding protein, partial [Candidatus Limnocylindrales bacterium]
MTRSAASHRRPGTTTDPHPSITVRERIRLPRSSVPRPALLGVLALGAILALAGLAIAAPGGSPTPASSAARAASSGEATVALGAPTSLDPAVIGDAASAGVVAQLFESLTAFDENLVLRPALARSWDIFDGGQRFVFHLRPGLTFSDGTPLSGPDVVRSWFRLIDPAAPSPLASLLFDVEGASDYVRGGRDRSSVGLTASGDDVEVRLRHPATDFVAILTGPSLAVVPPSVGTDEAALLPGRLVSSGGYRLLAATPDELTLEANDRYWAGPPAIRTVHLKTDLAGRSPADAFESGDVDYAGISAADASWIAYDPDLGPQLRSVLALSTDYYGFDTTRPPFDDVRVRQAFAMAVNWHRIVALVAAGDSTPATSMVPPGIPGRPDANLAPTYDPTQARALLADAGYPGGKGFPRVTLVSSGYGYDEAIVRELHDVLGIQLGYETMPFDQYFNRLSSDAPP